MDEQIAPRRPRLRGRVKKKANCGSPFPLLAEWTGLEPATPGVTGRYSNQLNYHSKFALSCLVGADGFEPPTFAL